MFLLVRWSSPHDILSRHLRLTETPVTAFSWPWEVPPGWDPLPGGYRAASAPGTRGLQGVPRDRQQQHVARPHLGTSPCAWSTLLGPAELRAQRAGAPAGPTAVSPHARHRRANLGRGQDQIPTAPNPLLSPQHSDSSPARTTSLPAEQLPTYTSFAQPVFKEIQ